MKDYSYQVNLSDEENNYLLYYLYSSKDILMNIFQFICNNFSTTICYRNIDDNTILFNAVTAHFMEVVDFYSITI